MFTIPSYYVVFHIKIKNADIIFCFKVVFGGWSRVIYCVCKCLGTCNMGAWYGNTPMVLYHMLPIPYASTVPSYWLASQIPVIWLTPPLHLGPEWCFEVEVELIIVPTSIWKSGTGRSKQQVEPPVNIWICHSKWMKLWIVHSHSLFFLNSSSELYWYLHSIPTFTLNFSWVAVCIR